VTVRLAPVVTEAQFLRQVLELARIFRWRAYHPQLSKWSERGWPDVALVRPPRVVLAELKSERGKVTPQQQEWLDDLSRCPGVESFVWRPADFEAIVEILR
jgi:VRR-NUC domain